LAFFWFPGLFEMVRNNPMNVNLRTVAPPPQFRVITVSTASGVRRAGPMLMAKTSNGGCSHLLVTMQVDDGH
jgi:hypothetical protein